MFGKLVILQTGQLLFPLSSHLNQQLGQLDQVHFLHLTIHLVLQHVMH